MIALFEDGPRAGELLTFAAAPPPPFIYVQPAGVLVLVRKQRAYFVPEPILYRLVTGGPVLLQGAETWQYVVEEPTEADHGN